MTKVQVQFRVLQPPDSAAIKKLADTSSLYGILRLQLDTEALTVEYDASRLRETDVEAALRHAGIDVQPA